MLPKTNINQLSNLTSKFQTFEERPVIQIADPNAIDSGNLYGYKYRATVLGQCLEALGAEVIMSGNNSWPRNEGLVIPNYNVSILVNSSLGAAPNDTISNYRKYTPDIIKTDFDFGGNGNVIYLKEQNTLLYGMDHKSGLAKHYDEFAETVKNKISGDIKVLPIYPKKGASADEIYDLDLYVAVTNEGHIIYSPAHLSDESMHMLKDMVSKDTLVEINEKGGVNFCQVGKYLVGKFNSEDKQKLENLGYITVTHHDLKRGNPVLITNRPFDSDSERGSQFSFFDATRPAGPHCYTQTLFAGKGARLLPNQQKCII